MVQDAATALFSLTVHWGDNASLFLKGMHLLQIRVHVQGLVDLRDPEITLQTIGVGPAALRDQSTPGEETVMQRLCGVLVKLGFPGAIVPSALEIGKNYLVLFPSNFQGNDGVEVLSIMALQA